MITAIILTFNEKLHIERCISNVQQVADEIIIVDSFSTDGTQELARALGAKVIERKFIHQADQLQWAIDNLEFKNEWIIRLDADEFLTPELVNELKNRIPLLPPDIMGVHMKRRVYFMNQWIRRGYYPMILLRIWRKGHAYVEQKWMDEHIRIKDGQTLTMKFDFVDQNLNGLSWWTSKHNSYSTREAIEILNRKYQLTASSISKEGLKRDKSFYLKLPLFLRPLLYFFFRYIFRFGILEGKAGLIWHVLQGFWYRFLVDAKIYQIERIARIENKSIPQVLDGEFGVRL
ncbi:MAG: glycosyltransferase family 2 protein [Saprospiraceae bacterium]